jgi:hypothetical protein
MIAVLQDGCAVNHRNHACNDISGIFAWFSANIGHPDRKEAWPFVYPLILSKSLYEIIAGSRYSGCSFFDIEWSLLFLTTKPSESIHP